MMTDWDFKGVYSLIKNKKNPEFWHETNNTHPGLGWNIKTVIPQAEYASDELICVVSSWTNLCGQYPALLIKTNVAFDWDGNTLEEWQTIWIKDGFDVVSDSIYTEYNQELKLVVKMKGQDSILENIISNLKLQLYRTMDKMEEEEYTNLLEILEILVQSNEHDVQERRKNIKVIAND